MYDLWMELNGIKSLFRMFHRRCWTNWRAGRYSKSVRHLRYIIRMAHPANRLDSTRSCRQILFSGNLPKKHRIRKDFHLCFSVFRNRRCLHSAPKLMRQKLCTVAYSENRNTKLIYRHVTLRRVSAVNAVWPAGKNNSLWIFRLYFRC